MYCFIMLPKKNIYLTETNWAQIEIFISIFFRFGGVQILNL